MISFVLSWYTKREFLASHMTWKVIFDAAKEQTALEDVVKEMRTLQAEFQILNVIDDPSNQSRIYIFNIECGDAKGLMTNIERSTGVRKVVSL